MKNQIGLALEGALKVWPILLFIGGVFASQIGLGNRVEALEKEKATTSSKLDHIQDLLLQAISAISKVEGKIDTHLQQQHN